MLWFQKKRKAKEEKIAKEKERRQQAEIRTLIESASEPEPDHTGAYISLRHINKIYDDSVQAVFDFNLDVKKKEFIVLVGPSGCGKSTTLRMIAGLEEITSGDLFIDGVYANDLASKDRDIAMVFQSYALYPHMSVYDNMAFALKIKHMPKDEIDKRVHEAAKILQIEDYLDRKPKALSGGQRQRVALGRAIVRHAKAFLMDEPLSNLDAKLRVQMRSEIIKLHETLDATTIYVTHDQTEAMTMATRIVVMKDGVVQQIGTPFEIYTNPANLFVATFIGSPAMNIFDAVYDQGTVLFKDGAKIPLNKDLQKAHDDFYEKAIAGAKKKTEDLTKSLETVDSAHKAVVEGAIKKLAEDSQTFAKCLKEKHSLKFGIRPEDVYEYGEEEKKKYGDFSLDLDVSVAELLGQEYYVHSSLGGIDFVSKLAASAPIAAHQKVKVILNLSKAHCFDELTGKKIF
jgi:multiple sugar transport system ATP-binding protein